MGLGLRVEDLDFKVSALGAKPLANAGTTSTIPWQHG